MVCQPTKQPCRGVISSQSIRLWPQPNRWTRPSLTIASVQRAAARSRASRWESSSPCRRARAARQKRSAAASGGRGIRQTLTVQYTDTKYRVQRSTSGGALAMLQELVGQRVVVDLRSPFVCLGTLQRLDEHYLELRNADLHDLRDTDTSRENYVAESRATGIKRNRRRVWVLRTEVVAVSLLEDVVDD